MPPRRPRRHAGAHDLIEALGQPGCPVCRLADEAVEAFLASVCYEQVNDLDVREELRTIGGFCRLHAHRFLRQRHGRLAAAIVYRDVLAAAGRRIEALGRSNGGRLGGLLGSRPARRRPVGPDEKRCPACAALAESERRHLDTLRERLRDERVREAYRAADGLCLPHLDLALAADDEAAGFLATCAVATTARLVEELDRYIQKHDYRFRPERWDDDAATPARAVEQAAGRLASGD